VQSGLKPITSRFKSFHLNSQVRYQFPMGVKAKSRCRLGMPKVNNLGHSYINIIKLENCDPSGECLIDSR